jgi:hypothetical protein
MSQTKDLTLEEFKQLIGELVLQQAALSKELASLKAENAKLLEKLAESDTGKGDKQ